MKLAYQEKAKQGNIVYGISNPKKKRAFINLKALRGRQFNELTQNITHETLHISGKLKGSKREEGAINKMLVWTNK